MKRSFLPVTDMAQVKRIARTFLFLDPKLTPLSPIAIQHPFTKTAFVGIRGENGVSVVNILQDEQGREAWQRQVQEAIEKCEFPGLLRCMITDTWQLVLLKYIRSFLSAADYAEWLGHAWTTCEAPNKDANYTLAELVSAFQIAQPDALMHEDENGVFQSLEDVITVYRGVGSRSAKCIKALSWTLDKEMARWYARRFGMEGKVYEAQIEKQYVYAYFSRRSESEIILDPRHILEPKIIIE